MILKTTHFSDSWVVLHVHTMTDVVAELDRLTGGAYTAALDAIDADPKDWAATRAAQAIRDDWMADARQIVESRLSDPRTYAPEPLRVTCQPVGIGETETRGGTDPEYVVACYLEYPEYTPTVSLDGQASPPRDYISRAIKVNQVGYLPDGPKVAYVGAWIPGLKGMPVAAQTAELCEVKTGNVVWSGPIEIVEGGDLTAGGKEITGEILYRLDFTAFDGEGDFYLQVPRVGMSWPFRIAADVYGDVWATALRGIMGQRCGCNLPPKVTNWPRKACHLAPVGECDYVMTPRYFTDRPNDKVRFDVIGASTDMSTAKPQKGGWHDAADWDGYLAHYTVTFDLLYAYELAPETHTDGQLMLPESGNGIPDILDEVAWGLEKWRRSMDRRGGVSGMVETWTHAKIDGPEHYAFSRRTCAASLLFAAAAAMLAEHLRPFSERKSGSWHWYARKAYRFGMDAENDLGKVEMRAATNRGQGEPYTIEYEEAPGDLAPLILHAKTRMFMLTTESEYLINIDNLIAGFKGPYKHPFRTRDYSPWIALSVIQFILSGFDRYVAEERWFLSYADDLLAMMATMPYGCAWERDRDSGMAWGAGSFCNAGRALLIAYHITGEAKYRDAAIRNFDYMLGCNPMGMSWTTGMGSVYPVNIQHAISQDDGIADPVPGITVYGCTGGMYPQLKALGGHTPPVWRTWSAHPTLNVAQCEFTIQETMSATAFCAALLTPAGYRLRALPVPRDIEHLHGLYPVP